MSLSATEEQAILNHILGTTTLTKPTTVYLALFTTTPTMPAGTGGVEVSGGSYARQPIAFGSASGSAPAVAANSALVTFPTATTSWGTIAGAGIYDAVTGGNLIDAGALSASKTIGTSDVFAMPAGNYTMSLT
jgi:hypothetical protein